MQMQRTVVEPAASVGPESTQATRRSLPKSFSGGSSPPGGPACMHVLHHSQMFLLGRRRVDSWLVCLVLSSHSLQAYCTVAKLLAFDGQGGTLQPKQRRHSSASSVMQC